MSDRTFQMVAFVLVVVSILLLALLLGGSIYAMNADNTYTEYCIVIEHT